jgi:hypothetical protein
MFPDKEIRRSRQGDIDKIDILITTVDGNVDQHNKMTSFINTPFVVYFNPTDFDEAVTARDKFVTLFEIGMAVGDHSKPGFKRRVPMWQWPETGTPPPDEEAVMGWLKIREVSSRVVEQEAPGEYLTVCEFTCQSYRTTYSEAYYPELTTVNPPTIEVQP